ncbi:MAG TPA: phosphoenolpyruvate carboxykinase (ATP), partial [Thermoleophilia bacterium]|nr:phosphoenolpyruvate carboxykinase (ATP) [Thermoleophilia bacterium]
EGSLDGVPMTPHPVFGVDVPSSCPGIPDQLLDARSTWADPAEYDLRAATLARQFAANFEAFSGRVSPEIAAAGPRTAG